MVRRIVPSRLRIDSWVAMLLVSLLAADLARAASAPAVAGRHGMVVAPEALATRTGVEVLRSGGNAIDAAVAVSFVLAVTYPIAAPLGGGGFLLYRVDTKTHHALDFREVAPQALEARLFLDAEGRPIDGLSLDSGLGVGVPGGVAGLYEAHRRWGTRPWADLLAPAVALASEGFPVYPYLARGLEREASRLAAIPETRRIFTDDGAPLAAGRRLVQRDLAATLRRIAKDGPAGFYAGSVAGSIVAAVQAHRGVMELGDLEGYLPVLRDPLVGNYRGYRIVAFPPPSSGGVTLLQILGMLERWNVGELGPGSSAAIHVVAESERRAFADRSRWLGDPDFFDVPVAGLLAPDYLAARASDIRLDRVSPSESSPPGRPLPSSDGETLHLSIADDGGRAVAMTLTLNAWFGSAIVAPGTGVLLNNEMDDFAVAPGRPNKYGLVGGEANAIRGGKRPLSSMSPTIVETRPGAPRPLLVLGSPGGPKIITSVLQVLLNVLDHGMPLQEAVDAPRFHHQWHPDRLLIERRGAAEDVERNLTARGHVIETAPDLGNVNAIGVDGDGRWLGAADPRREGRAEGY